MEKEVGAIKKNPKIEINELPDELRREWLHLIALQLGGPNSKKNAVVGGQGANKIMEIFERNIHDSLAKDRSYLKITATVLEKAPFVAENIRYQVVIQNSKSTSYTKVLNVDINARSSLGQVLIQDENYLKNMGKEFKEHLKNF